MSCFSPSAYRLTSGNKVHHFLNAVLTLLTDAAYISPLVSLSWIFIGFHPPPTFIYRSGEMWPVSSRNPWPQIESVECRSIDACSVTLFYTYIRTLTSSVESVYPIS